MVDHTQSVMVALRPITTDWAKVALPHLTLAYAGEKVDLKPTDFNELAKATAGIAMDFPVIPLYTEGLDVFGEEPDKVEVIRFKPTTELMQMRQRVVGWNASNWPFNPHSTIGPLGTFETGNEMPAVIAFDRVMLSWGEEELNFWLKH